MEKKKIMLFLKLYFTLWYSNNLKINRIMLLNYLKTALRNIKRNALFSFIAILGLALGMAACLLILHYVNFERSYDRFYKNSERIYRLRYERTSDLGQKVQFASCCPPAVDVIRGSYPEVEEIARIFRYRAVVSPKDQDIQFREERMYFAESEFFNIFDLTFAEGNPSDKMRKANNAFMSQSTAIKYFGKQDPVGQTITVDGKTDYTVTGIFQDVPSNSHLKFDILLSYQNLFSIYGPEVLQSWGHTGFFTYIRFRPDANPASFEKKMEKLVETHANEMMSFYKVKIELKMQPLTDIHLTSHFMQEYEINGNKSSIDILLIVAVFIIFMAWINYVNLSTSRSLTRAKEVGMRKIVGASQRQLIAQFFCETFLIFTLAITLALILLIEFLPLFSRVTGTPLVDDLWKTSWFWITLLSLLLASVFLSGSYPVVALSAYKPVAVIRGELGTTPRGMNLRKSLVVFQFGMALVLITSTFSIYNQIDYMKNQKLGFDIEQIFVISTPRVRYEALKESFTTFKEELLKQPNIQKVCVVSEVPGRQIIWDNGGIHRAGADKSQGKNYQIVGVDYDFVDVFDLDILQGRNFSKEFLSDKDALILNETAVKWMGFNSIEEAIGKEVDYWGELYPIIGVLADYHQQSLKEAFEPHIYRFFPYGRPPWGRFAIKIGSQNIEKSVQLVKEYYAKFFPGNPFEFFFLDDYFNQQYKSDELLGRVVGLFSFLAIFVTCLGIFGMSAFMAIQRTKEIGIRKVLGATTDSILKLLIKKFLLLIGISLIISWPLAYWGIQQWLNAFAYRMPWSVFLFLVPLVIVSAVTIVTVSSNILKAALANPVDSIKHE
jgi:putative ABC transport system permease protein